MIVVHNTLKAKDEIEVILPVKTGRILVKNKTQGSIKVSIGSKDFTNNYVKIDKDHSEELYNCAISSACPSQFFNKVYVSSSTSGEIEIRCLVI